MTRTVVIGAGPAGLSAGLELVRRGERPLVLEAGTTFGGIARTELYKGYRFDVGGHRFFTKVPEVQRLWTDMLGDDLRITDRRSRIFYDGKFYRYPLEIANALRNLGPRESITACLSYLRAGLSPKRPADTFEDWVSQRFGRRLYRRFFAAYTEKVWGVAGSEISADWASQRIQDLSLLKAVTNAVFGVGQASTLIRSFHYPRLGPGMMWTAFADRVAELGGDLELAAEVEGLSHRDGRVSSVLVGGEAVTVTGVVSSMPISQLVTRLDPAPPDPVMAAAEALRHRSLISVGLILDRDGVFPDQWIYVHSPEVRVGRIQNFANWSADLVARPGTSHLGLEYFCDEDDELWRLPDAELIRLASRELARLGLAARTTVVDGMVIRQAKAYPLYDAGFDHNLRTLRRFLAGFSNLRTIGRNGMHRYNNMDHAMLTGAAAVASLAGEDADPWAVNTERSYHESGKVRPR